MAVLFGNVIFSVTSEHRGGHLTGVKMINIWLIHCIWDLQWW